MKRNCIILAAVLCLEGCASIYSRTDSENPCSSTNVVECEQWKRDFPREYEKYRARMKKNGDPKATYSAGLVNSTNQ